VIALILGALIAVAAVVIVALPFLRDTGEPELIDDPGSERILLLIEDRDHALAALKELEFDHRTGKVDDADYRAGVGPLRRAAAEALQALDAATKAKASSAEEDLTEQEEVQAYDQPGNGPGNHRGEAAVDERAHEVAARREPDERHEGERDPEGQHHL
jgi:hypothetical protein